MFKNEISKQQHLSPFLSFSFWSVTMIQMWQEIKEEKREHKYWEAKTTQLCLSVLE